MSTSPSVSPAVTPAPTRIAAPAPGALTEQSAPPSMKYSSQQMRDYSLLTLAVIVGVGLLFYFLGPIMTPFVLGGVAAYVGAPLVSALEKRGMSRAIGALIVILLVCVAITGLVFIIVPLVQTEISNLVTRIPGLITRAQNEWLPWLQQKLGIQLKLNFDQLRAWLTENVADVGGVLKRVMQSVTAGGAAILGILGTVLLTPLVMFYLLQDWPKLLRELDSLVPRGLVNDVRNILGEIDRVLGEYLHGQLLVMVSLGAFLAIGLELIGLEHGLSIGIISGLMIFIPYVGFGLGLALALLSAVTQFGTWMPILLVLVLYFAGQMLESFYLTPKLVGERVGLHPLIVLFALMAFGQLFGFVGVLAAVPVSAILLVALRHARASYLNSDLYTQRHDDGSSDPPADA